MLIAPPLAIPLKITPNGTYGVPRPKRDGVHLGLDFHAPEGTPVYSATSGVIARKGYDKPVKEGGGGGGNYVVVESYDGNQKYELGYFHLQKPSDLAVNFPILAGGFIGYAGSTGAESSGAHLHFQAKRINGSSRDAIDPTSWFFGGSAGVVGQVGEAAANVAAILALVGLGVWWWRTR